MPVVDGCWVAPDKALNFKRGQLSTVNGKRVPMVRASDVDKLERSPIFQLTMAKAIAMDIEQTAVEASGAAEEAMRSLKVAMDKLKSTLANDLTSIKAAGSRVQSEALQIRQAYKAAEDILTTAEFERAVANAERMAAALKAISELSETKLSVTMFSSGGDARDTQGSDA
jgi:hypothetical protein